jgi:CRP-like cAMP-binding protein
LAEEIEEALVATGLFGDLSPEELARVAEVGRVEYWKPEAMVLEEGTFGPRMMVLLEGRVEILRRDSVGILRSIAELGPGDVLGEMSLLLELPRTATVRAIDDLRVFAMDRAAFQEMVDAGDPAVLKLGLQLSRVLARRLMALNDRVMSLLQENETLRLRFGDTRQEVFRLWEVEDDDADAEADEQVEAAMSAEVVVEAAAAAAVAASAEEEDVFAQDLETEEPDTEVEEAE